MGHAWFVAHRGEEGGWALSPFKEQSWCLCWYECVRSASLIIFLHCKDFSYLFFRNVSFLVFGCAGSPSRCGLLLAVGSGRCSGDVVGGLLRSVAPLVMAPRLESTGSIAVAPGLGCSAASGFLLAQWLNPCLLHWRAESLPLSHQGSPKRTLPACGSNLRKILLPICLLRNQPGTYSQARHESTQSIFNTHGTTQV